MNNKVLKVISSFKYLRVNPQVNICLPSDYWFVCHSTHNDEYVNALGEITGVYLDPLAKYDGQSFIVDVNRCDDKVEEAILRVCVDFRRKTMTARSQEGDLNHDT